MKPVQHAICQQCGENFRFIRYGKKPRSYCEVCRELRYQAQRAEFYRRQDATEQRLASRTNAIKCHEAVNA